ncbi:diheme cytochrome c [Dechloromonas sp. XY25]|uniref:Diheme cytochrome c n=1 Tax=Dechloromonas hankyongensis TaxID=2908002 RepID=A0ABS9K4C6_9RHOO|nr:cytochrome C [Dechloromonas hankyongensis]MCG2578024.1 diheme cytochrome c [Dechloromonas hankyongensis]
MKKLIPALLLAISLPALADRLPLPADTPASYRAECGSCHLPYPPSLLASGDWRRLLSGLDTHFGSDASLNAEERQAIAAFLARHAGSLSRLGDAGNPPRISQTARFVRHHREVPARFWRDPRVKSAANCEACHRGAANGHFGEHDIAIPELRE